MDRLIGDSVNREAIDFFSWAGGESFDENKLLIAVACGVTDEVLLDVALRRAYAFGYAMGSIESIRGLGKDPNEEVSRVLTEAKERLRAKGMM